MTKSKLIEEISRRLDQVPKKDVEATVEAVFEQIASALCNDERIALVTSSRTVKGAEIRGWGGELLKQRKEREPCWQTKGLSASFHRQDPRTPRRANPPTLVGATKSVETGEPVEVPRKRTPFFTAGKALKERVNEGFQRELGERA